MVWAISSVGTAAMAAGVRARSRSAGITALTILSVVWALSITATSSEYGSSWASGMGGVGYNRSRISAVLVALSARFTGARAARRTRQIAELLIGEDLAGERRHLAAVADEPAVPDLLDEDQPPVGIRVLAERVLLERLLGQRRRRG